MGGVNYIFEFFDKFEKEPINYLYNSVPDPKLIISDPDPDPQNENQEFRIRILLLLEMVKIKLSILVIMKTQMG